MNELDVRVTSEEALHQVKGLLLRKIDLTSKTIAAGKDREQALATLESKG